MIKAYVCPISSNRPENLITLIEKDDLGFLKGYTFTDGHKMLYEAAIKMTSINNFYDYLEGHSYNIIHGRISENSTIKELWETKPTCEGIKNFEFLYALVSACSDADENWLIEKFLIRVLENYFLNEEHVTCKPIYLDGRYTLVNHTVNDCEYSFVVDLTTNEKILYKDEVICFKEKKLNKKSLLNWLAGVTHKDTVEFIRRQALFSEDSNNEFFIEGDNIVEYNVAENGVEYEKIIYSSINIHNALVAIASGAITNTKEFFRTLYHNGTHKHCAEKTFTKPLSKGYTFKTLVKITEFHYKNSTHYAENAEAYFNLHSYSLYRLSSLMLEGYYMTRNVEFAPNYVEQVAYKDIVLNNKEYPVKAFVDFCSNAVITKVADLTIKKTEYESLEALVESLWNLDFEELTSIDEEELRKAEELVKINY